MRSLALGLCAVVAACAAPAPPSPAAPTSAAPVTAAPDDGVLSAGLESRYVLQSGDGEAYLGVLIRPPADAAKARPPVSLAMVIDTSGSMSGEQKIENARHAAGSIIKALDDRDQLTLVRFSSDVQTLLPRTPLGQADRAQLLDLVAKLDPNGRTALHGGLSAGIDGLKGSGDAVRRVLLISDGQANVGPSRAAEIIAQLPAAESATTFSTIGVGADYDAAVMTAVAEHGGGGFHHLTDPVQLAGILEAELEQARTVAGTGAVLTLHPEPGVEIIGGPGLIINRAADGSVTVQVGEVHAGETRTVSIKVKVPPTGPQKGLLGRVSLAYTPVDGAAKVERDTVVRFERTPSAEAVAQGEVPAYMVAADRMRVAHVLVDAAALLKEGDLLEAQALLRDERGRLQGRRARLDGAAQAEADALIRMFEDPIVDAELGASSTAPTVDEFDALVEAIRQGREIEGAKLDGLPKGRLRILRNVAYARHGYRFKSADLQAWFANRKWYQPDAGFEHGMLTTTDVQTVALVKTWEKRAGIAAVKAPKAAKGADLTALIDVTRAGDPLQDKALRGLSLKQLRILRNTAFARHGYAFRARDLRQWFGGQPWYRVDASFANQDLTPTDVANVRRIKARERSLLSGAKDSVRELELRTRSRAVRVTR